MNYKKHIFLYDQNDNLITYVDLDENGGLINFYELKDRVLTKMNCNSFNIKGQEESDIKKAKITFSEDCKLIHMFNDGDSYCKAIKKDSKLLESPNILSKIYSFGDEPECYSISASLVENWIKKV